MLNIILSALAGSTAAFITHKYTEKKYENNNRFGYKFADLLENEIINASKIQEQFDKAELDDDFNEISEKFFNNYFMDDIKNLKLGDISIFEDSYYGIKETIQDLFIKEMSEESNSTLFDVNANFIFDDEQTHLISSNIAKNLSVFFEKTNTLELCSEKILECIGDMSVNDILTPGFMKAVEKNLDSYSIKFMELIKENYDEKIDEMLIKSLDGAELNDIISEVIENISEEKLYIAMGIDRRKFINQLITDIEAYFKTDYGKNMVYVAATDIFNNIEYKKTSLYDIVDKTFEKTIKSKIKKYECESEKVLEKWIDDMRSDVGESINISVRKYVSDENLAKKITTSMLAIYDKNNKPGGKGEVYSIVKNSYEDFNEDKRNDTVDNYIVNEIYKKLGKIYLGDYIGKTTNINSPDDVYKYLIEDLENKENSALRKLLKELLNSEVSEIIKIDINKFMKVRYKYVLVDYIKDQLFYNKQIYKVMTGKMSKLVYSLKDKSVKDVIDDDALKVFASNFKLDLGDRLYNDSESITVLQSKINKYMNESTLGDFMHLFNDGEDEEFRNDNLKSLINFMFSSKYDEIAEIRAGDLIKKIANSKDATHSVSKGFKGIITKSLRSISKGFVYVKVINHFNALPKDQYDDYYGKVSAYSSKKLFGVSALFGGIFGVVLSQLLSTSTSTSIMVIASAGVGILIDVCFINGFYRKKSKTNTINIRRKFDFKNRIKLLIEGASEATENDEEKEIVARSDNQISVIKYDIKTSLTEKKSEIVGDSIANNAHRLSDVFANEFHDFLMTEKKEIASKYYSDIIRINVKKMFSDKNLKKFNESMDKNKESATTGYLDFVFELLGKNELGKVCSTDFKKSLFEVFDSEISKQYSGMFSSINSPKDLGNYFDKKIAINFDDKSLKDVFSQESIDDVETNIFDKLYYGYFNKTKLNNLSYDGSNQLNKFYFDEKKLGDLLSRRAKIMITSMFYKRFNDSIYGAQGYIKNHRVNKINDVLFNLYNRLNNKEDKAFKLLGEEKVIQNILDDFYGNEMEKICRDNLEKLYDSSKNFTVEILNLFSRDVGLYVHNDEYEKVIYDLTCGVKESEVRSGNVKALVYIKVAGIFDNFYKYFLDYKYKDYKKFVFDFKISKFMDYQQKYFSKGLNKVISYYVDNKEELLSKNSKTMEEMYTVILNNVKLADMCKCKLEIKKELYEKILEADENTDFIDLTFTTLFDGIYNYLESMDTFNSFIDSKKLKYSLEDAIDKVYDKDSFSNILSEAIEKNFSGGIENAFLSKFSEDTKHYMLDMIVDEIFVNIDNHMDTLYDKLNITEIIERGLVEMDSKNAENLFEYHDLQFDKESK